MEEPPRKKAASEEPRISSLLQSVTDYTASFLRSTCVECLVQGNISAQRTTDLSQNLKGIILKYSEGKATLADAHSPPQQVILLPLDKAIVMCVAPRNPNEKNKCVEAYFQLGESHS